MKKCKPSGGVYSYSLKKTLKIMRNIIILLIAGVLQASAIDGYAQKTKLSLNFSNTELINVLDKIEDESEFFFLYNEKLLDVNRKVSISEENQLINVILDELFANSDVAYTIFDRKIILAPENLMSRETAKELQQQQVVSGRVTDQTGAPMPGVNIQVKGTMQGSITDADGKYTISIQDKNASLVFSFIGYVTQEIALAGRNSVDITLANEVLGLNEVVVTALGIKREAKTLGYSTAVINQGQLTENRTSTAMGTLQGKISGVNITSLGTGPAGSTKIRIRGNSSFSGANTPLIVVNGVPLDNTHFGSGSGLDAVDGGDGLSSLNPDDIESMTVLKGAAAAALYGSRAKDGVIMITTRLKGDSKGFGVTYNVNYTTETPLDFTDFQYEYGQGERGIRPTTAWPTSGVWSFGEKIQPGMTQVLFDGVEVPYVAVKDRIKEFYRMGSNLVNTVSFSNNGEQGGFDLSLSNSQNTSIIENSDFNKKNITLGFTQNVSKWVTVSGNVNYSNEYNHNPAQVGGQDLSSASAVWTTSNTMPWDLLRQYYKDQNGNENLWSRFIPRSNPYWSILEHFDNVYRDRLFGNISVRFNVTKDIYVQGRIAQDYYARQRDYNNPTGTGSLAVAPSGYVNGRYYKNDTQFRERNYDFLVGVQHKFGDIGVNVTAGGNQMFRQTKNINESAEDFVQRGLYTIMNGRTKTASHNLVERAVNSLYGSAELSYKSYLFLNMTGRNDWFSTLSPDNRSIFYPSATGSFIFTEAIKGMPSWLSFGKFRLSYAEVGDDNVAAYSNVMYYNVNNNLYPSVSGSVPVGGFASQTIPNPNLRPLRVSESEAGVDLRLFNNAVGFDFAYYKKITRDQIISASTSYSTGYSTQLINVGESESKGFETAISLSPVETKNFKWDLNANLSYNTSKVLVLGENAADTMITIGSIREVVGQKLGQIYVWEQKVDANGNKVFDKASGYPVRANQMVSAGTNQPTWFGGITNTFNYKGIILSALIDFKLGKDYVMLGGANRHYWRHGLHKGTLPGREENVVIGDGVNPDGGVNTTAAPLQPYYEQFHSLGIMDYWKANAGFWKLRQVGLSYDFGKFLPRIEFIKGLKLSVVSNNVAILKKWVQNMDPENLYEFGDNGDGSGWSSLPPTRSLGFNLNVKF
jgi:TonB-linked SusC/RagA family outer membrane protein